MRKVALTAGDTDGKKRWFQLFLCILCMGLVANIQYSWTLFVRPLHSAFGWSDLRIQVAFTIFIMAETWLVPIEGMIVDRFGPRPVIAGGAILIMIAWTVNSFTDSLYVLYLDSLLSGIGAGCVYGTCVGVAMKWFPDRRGFAGGLAAAGFGIGAALTIIPIANEIAHHGYRSAFLKFGLILGGAILLISALMVKPTVSTRPIPAQRNVQSKRDYTTAEMMKTPVFWVCYAIFTAMSAGGLIATAHIASVARDFGIASAPIALFGTVVPLLTLTLSVDNLVNGFTRPLCGLISDRFGRENTMFLVFLGEGLALLGIIQYGQNPYLFLVFAPAVYLFWGEIYAISSALIGDTYGSRYLTANAGALFTTKGFAALIVPFGSLLRELTGRWDSVFFFCAAIAILSAVVSRFVLGPMRRNFIARSNAELLDKGGMAGSDLQFGGQVKSPASSS
ncbi:oxalate/formate MFS antiporter [Paraburkholderia fungorum]|uniref:oxalate/formate MFS antiporter n=1 Tax=Paraburkholderia fungorum TaxID=134537 RepID=UPI0038B76D28